jgi:hypothetical protein
MSTARRGGTDGPAWETLEFHQPERLPAAALPVCVRANLLAAEGQRVLEILLAARMWSMLPSALLTRVGR